MSSNEIDNTSRNNALIIGGGITGLLTARILADHFNTITIIERDTLPDNPEFRKGIPQSRHIHVILMRCSLILEQLFPGFKEELYNAGAQSIHYPEDIAWFSRVGWSQRSHSHLQSYSCSRELLEWSIRNRLMKNDKIKIMTGYDVIGLVSNPQNTHVVGVQIQSRDTHLPETVHASLVVDATGRSSRASEWLVKLGYPCPQTTIINARLGYASRCYLRPDNASADWKGIIIQGNPPEITRSGVLFPIEHNRWIVSLISVGGDYPSDDEKGFLEFAHSLRDPVIVHARVSSLSHIGD